MSEEATLDEFANADGDDTTESATDTETLNQEQFGPFTLSTPGEWSAKRLGDIKRLITRGKQPTYDDDGIPVINQECIYWDGWHFENLRYLDENVGEDWKDKYFAQRGDIILNSTGQGTLGRAQVYPDNKRRAIDSHVTLIRTEDDLNPHFHRYFFESHLGQALLYSMCVNGSTGQIELSKTRLDLQPVPLPPLSEQRKIATVLYTVDRAIEKTEEIKQQIERVCDGVRQDVFSRGIRESGTERTDDELKDTYLGAVPEGWQLRRVDEVCSHVVDCPHSTPNYSEQGTPVVRTSEIEDGRYYPAESPRVDEEGYQKRISRLEPKPGDVVFTREAPIGEAFKIPEGMKLCLGQRLMQLRPKEGVLDADFLVELLYSDMMQSWFERSARGSTSTHVNVGDIEKMEIPVPPIEEQHRIVAVLGGFREQLDSERDLLSRFERLKRGLMQDLLSGTVRTTDTNIEVPNEIAQYG